MSKHNLQKDRGADIKVPEGELAVFQRDIHSGPLPHPEILKGYQQIDPSFPERIMAMAEREQEHAHSLEEQRNKNAILITTIGVATGFIVFIMLCVALYFSIINALSSVAISIVGAMAGIIGLFVYVGRK